MDLDRFTKKLGPLPVWAWALIIVAVGYGAYRFTIGKSVGSASYSASDTGTGADTGLDAGLPGEVSAGTLPPASTPSGGSGYVADTSPGVNYVPPITFPYDSSAFLGLSSFGDYTPSNDALIVDNTTPNLTTGSVATVAQPTPTVSAARVAAGVNAAQSGSRPSAQATAKQAAALASVHSAAADVVAQSKAANTTSTPIGTTRVGPNGKLNRWTGTAWVRV